MSRIGNKPVPMPTGVSVTFEKGILTVNGPKGTLTQEINFRIGVKQENNELILEIVKNSPESNAMHGLYRALTNNMVQGVTTGFSKKLIIAGVGYKANVNGGKLILNLGLSHSVEVLIPQDLQVVCPTVTEIVISGISKEKVGQFASKIKDLRPVEPYHGYGIRYSDEVVVRKVGKTAGKGKK